MFFRMPHRWILPVAVLLLLVWQVLASDTDSSSAGMRYLDVPPNVQPLDGLLPSGGIGQNQAPLRKPERALIYEHDIDFETREATVNAKVVNNASRDTADLWSAQYSELAFYTMDMWDIGLNRMWLNSLIGQKDGGAEDPPEGALFDISIPVNMPAWMKDFGFDKPKLLLQGTMDIRLKGRGVKDDAPGSSANSLMPSPSPDFNPSFIVKGKIGRNITVEIDNTTGGLGVRNSIRVVYEEAVPGEFEDYILQRVEAGNTSLSLAGTELTGYSENHKGLFGIKSEWKIGHWRLTTIASQDGGNQESYTIRGTDQNQEFQIQDKQFAAYRYYFPTHAMRNAYIEARILGRYPSRTNLTGLKLYKRNPVNNKNGLYENMTGVYRTPNGQSVSMRGLPLIEMVEGTDYTFDPNTGILRMRNASRSTLIAASWSGDGTGRSGASVRNGDPVVLIQYDAAASNLIDIEKLMLRNIYAVGLSNSTSSQFILRMKDRNGRAGDFLKTLGVVDSSSGSVLVNDVSLFPRSGSDYTGDMWLPCREVSWYQNRGVANPVAAARNNCIEPLRNVDSSAAINQLYGLSVHNLNRYQPLYYFESVGKRRSASISVRNPASSYAVGGGSCMDIAPGSEKLKAGSEVLVRDLDYQVNYELGQIELISERALDPNKEITVNFECEPLFELDNKILLGARAEYPLQSFASGSLLGITALYKSQSSTSSQARLGSEPFSSFLWGANLRLIDSSRVMDQVVNAIPFIDTKSRSRWSFETEFAAAYHNANTSKRKSALLDDFESSAQILQFPLSRTMWTQASPPGGTTDDLATYIEKQDYRHAGEFVWHSNITQAYRHIYTPVGNSDVDNKQLTILSFRLRPNDNLEGNSWGGVMRANSSFYQDLSDKRYIEVVARGNVGSIYVDLGTVSEDLSINGFAPNGQLDSEADPGTTVALHDLGLDGVKESEETRQIWDCRVEGCVSDILNASNVPSSNTDIARDNFRPDLEDDNDPPVNINGTEGNAGERSFDTEDIDRNGTLDTDIRFVRYRIDLSKIENSAYQENLNNGWRRWRIPLDVYDTIVSGVGSNYTEILSESRYVRLWYGALNPGVAEGKAQIVDFRIIGNEWEENAGGNAFGISTNDVTQTVEGGGLSGEITAPGTVVVPDSNYLKVRVINNRDNASSYFISPNTSLERDSETNAALKEQSLVLEYGGLHPGQNVAATRFFDNEVKDLTSYKNLKMEIHYATDAASVPVRFALQFGQGGQDGSSDYYEWSFKPTKLSCNTGEREQDCHERNWLENAFALPLQSFTSLKAGRVPPYLQAVERAVTIDESALAVQRAERIKLVGNPSVSQINWIRFVIIADDSSSLSDLEGEFWVNDLRLTGMDSEWGYASRVHGQLDFADVMSVSAEARYQDGNFATLKSDGKSPKPSLSEANTRLDVNGTFGFNLNKFFDDEHGFRIPLGLSYSNTVLRPYLKPGSDQPLTRDDYGDLIPDLLTNDLEVRDSSDEARLREGAIPESKGYQSFSRTRSLSLGYSKEYKPDDKLYNEILSQIFLERPAINYTYSETESHAARRADSSYRYNTVLEYKLGTFNRSNIRFFNEMKPGSWNKGLPKMTFEPWPQTFDITVMDLLYSKTINQERDPDFVEPLVDPVVSYNVEMRHKANIRWNILPFLSTSYSLTIDRDMYGGGDRDAFVKNNYFSSSDGGLFAVGRMFDYDHTDRKIYKRDSIYTYPVDTLHNDSLGTDSIVYSSMRYYIIDSVGSREYGRAYGILRNERNRNQDFKINFNPEFIPFLPMRFSFGSTFNQVKSIPDNFDFTNTDHLEKNFWSIRHTNRFEFAPTLRMIELAGLGGKNAVTAFLEKLRWREIRSTWTVDLNTTGEDFTLWQLYEEQGVTPAQYYLYGLGFGNGYRNRGFWNLVSGDMGLDSRDDYVRFSQYRNRNVDSTVYQGNFVHKVRRSLSNGTGLTLPWWDIALRGDLAWSQEFTQPRENPLYLDTTVIWPKIGVSVDVPNFAHRLDFIKGKLRSLSTSHRLDYTESYTSRPFQSAEDEWVTTWDFNPLIRISALTPIGVRVDNSVRVKTEQADRRSKEQVLTSETWPDPTTSFSDTSDVYINTPWVRTLLYRSRGYAFGDELAISYALRAKRGFQLWRWYIKLENDIELRLAGGYDYKKIINEYYEPKTGYDPWNQESGTNGVHTVVHMPNGQSFTTWTPELEKVERIIPTRSHEWYVRPSAGYTFNKMASASAYIEYRHLTEQLDDDTKHTRQTLEFEIALLLRFN